MFPTLKSRLKQREVKSVQDFIDGETLAEATHLTSGVQKVDARFRLKTRSETCESAIIQKEMYIWSDT